MLLALAGYLAVHYFGGGRPVGCVVRAAEGGGSSYELTPEQADNAATVAAVGTTRGMPQRAVTIALATALQESSLRNIDYGDRDSLGLFQQRPSQGWGTPEQILDPVYSAGRFYAGLAEVPGYSRMPLTDAAQTVQRSGFPQAYAKHEPDATLLAAALTGSTAATLTCSVRSDGKPGDPAKVRAELVRAFGKDVLPGSGPGRGTAGAQGSAVLTVPVPAPGGPQDGADSGGAGPEGAEGPEDADDGGAERRGWELAHWAVARAEALRLTEVSYQGRVWSEDRSGEGWRKADGKPGDEVVLRIAH